MKIISVRMSNPFPSLRFFERQTEGSVNATTLLRSALSPFLYLNTSVKMNANVGRVAKLCNLVSKPELNGVYVMINSYNAANDRFGVRTLVAPNDQFDYVTIAVKFLCLEFYSLDTFASRYPHAPTQCGKFLCHNYEPGIIIDYSAAVCDASAKDIVLEDALKNKCADGHAFVDQALEMKILVFVKSCRAVGLPVCGAGLTVTSFPGGSIFSAESKSSTIIEVEFIHFCDTVMCAVCDNIVFRNCRFAASVDLRMGAHVHFESCLFEKNAGSGVILTDKSRATIVNCTFQDLPGQGVTVKEGCSATIIHSGFSNMGNSVYAPSKATIELINCSFQDAIGISVTGSAYDGSACTARGCKWTNGRQTAVQVEGPKRSTLLLEDSVITGQLMGVGALHGKVAIALTNLHISGSACHGVNLAINIAGTVEVRSCTFVNNAKGDIANMCCEGCVVTIDGVTQRVDDQNERQSRYFPDISELACKEGPEAAQTRFTVKQLRTYKKVSAAEIKCENCQTVEPNDTKFNVCSKCMMVCYCSRDCQVVHWKAVHKKECGKIGHAGQVIVNKET